MSSRKTPTSQSPFPGTPEPGTPPGTGPIIPEPGTKPKPERERGPITDVERENDGQTTDHDSPSPM